MVKTMCKPVCGILANEKFKKAQGLFFHIKDLMVIKKKVWDTKQKKNICKKM